MEELSALLEECPRAGTAARRRAFLLAAVLGAGLASSSGNAPVTTGVRARGPARRGWCWWSASCAVSVLVLMFGVGPTFPGEGQAGVDKARMDELLGWLGSDDWSRRSAAAFDLGELGPAARDAIPALLLALHDDSGWVRRDAAEALLKIGPEPRMIPDLVWLVKTDDRNRGPAIDALARIGPAVIPDVVPLLEFKRGEDGEDVNNTWGAAAEILAGIGAASVPALITALEDPSRREGALEALGRIGPDAAPAIPALLALRSDPDSRLRVSRALGGIGPSAVQGVPFLIDVVETTRGYSYEVRSAIQALGKIGPSASSAVPALRRRLKDGLGTASCEGCFYTIEALGRIGPAANEAVPEIRQAARLGDEGIRRVAAEAIRGIGSGKP